MLPTFPKAHAYDCVIPDERQQALSDRYLTPNMENIMTGIAKIRAKVDEHYEAKKAKDDRDDSQKNHLSGLTDVQAYPYGYCQPIRNMVWNSLHKSLKHPNAGQGHFVALRDFLAAGGLFRKIWGELTHGPYFQNAIQVGSYYLDASNDTVVVTKPKLEVMPLLETNFRNIDSFEHYFDVATSYYQWETYPNTVLPKIAAIFPAIAIHKKSGVMLVCDIPLTLMYKNMESGGQLAANFLKTSSYAGKTLPSSYADILVAHQNDVWQQTPQPTPRKSTIGFEVDLSPYSDQAVMHSFQVLKNWLSLNRKTAVYEKALINLDLHRKQFDRSLRRYSLTRPGDATGL